jgi:alpha-galactosidase
VHRWRSAWAAEARMISEDLEQLHLERSWQPHCVACERFAPGRQPALPQLDAAMRGRGHGRGRTWAAQLAWGGSWQLELYRRHGLILGRQGCALDEGQHSAVA